MRVHIVVYAGEDIYFQTYLDHIYRTLPSEATYNQIWNTLRPKLEAEFGVGVRLVEGPEPDTFSINVDRVRQ